MLTRRRASRLESGSSNSRTCGRMTSARAMATSAAGRPRAGAAAPAVAGELDQGQRLLDPAGDLGCRHLAGLQPVGDVAGDVRLGIPRSSGTPCRCPDMGGQAVDALRPEADLAAVELAEAAIMRSRVVLPQPRTQQGEDSPSPLRGRRRRRRVPCRRSADAGNDDAGHSARILEDVLDLLQGLDALLGPAVLVVVEELDCDSGGMPPGSVERSMSLRVGPGRWPSGSSRARPWC